MDETRFAAWKYQHEGAGTRSRKRLIGAGILLAAALPALFVPPLALFLLAVSLVLFFGSSKKFYLGPRYLICGRQIVYFANVTRLALDEGAGTLRLTSANDREFVLERAKFPTNARKTDKIARNKAAKFSKVAENLIGKVLKASPAAETSGISRSARQNG